MQVLPLGGEVLSDRTGPSAKTTLSRDEFMKILLSEITHQDPFNPVSNQDFLSQLVQLQTLEATSELAKGIGDLIAVNKLSSAGSLIGLVVRGELEGGEEIVGKVEKVVLRGKEPLLLVSGSELPLSNVREVLGEG